MLKVETTDVSQQL